MTQPSPATVRTIHAFYQKAHRAPVPPAKRVTAAPPSFFLIGAPRCGTTMLSAALKGNPQISFSKPKETQFFLLAPEDWSDEALRQRYLELHHPTLSAEHAALGDGSVSYLYSPACLRRALRFDPRARFIVTVRNPLELVPSHHARMVYTLDEDVTDFATAWRLQGVRAAGQRLPKRCRDPRVLQYGSVGTLGDHVERLLDIAGPERCLVLVYDDIARDPRDAYRAVLDFIGVPDDGRQSFGLKAENRGYKSPFLQQFVMNPPRWLFPLIRVADTAMIKRLKRVRRRLEKANRRPAQRPQLADAMAAELRAFYADDVRKLGELLSRDLDHWLA